MRKKCKRQLPQDWTGKNILVGGGQGQESGRVGSKGGAGPTSQPQDLGDSQALLPSPATFHF